MTRRYTHEPGPDVDLDREDVRDSRGRRITQRYVDGAVEDAHEQVARGRPSLSGPGQHSPQVSFRLPPELRERGEELARRRGVTLSKLARTAFERYLDQAS